METANPTKLPEINKLWDYNNPAETEQKFRDLLPEAEASGNLDYKGQLLTQIARTYSLRRMFAEAHETLKQVEALPLDELPVVKVRYLLELGRAYNSALEKFKAREIFLQAWNLAKLKRLDYYAVDAAHMLAIAEPSPKVQLQWNEAGIRYAETTKDPTAKQWLGSLYNNTGWTHHDMGNYAKALNIFERALVFRTNNNHPINTILIAKWWIARTHRSLGNVDGALRLQQLLINEYSQNGLAQDGYVYEELALLYDAKGNQTEAQKAAASAIALLSKDQYFATHEKKRLEQLQQLASV